LVELRGEAGAAVKAGQVLARLDAPIANANVLTIGAVYKS